MIPNIGTPGSSGALRVMLLGSGELGKEVIIELQRLGVETIAVDRYADAPAQQVAHRAHVIDMTDRQALRQLVENEKPHLIVPEIEAIATDELVAIESEGLCEIIPTARAAQWTMNRTAIRKLAAETLGLPTSPYRFATTQAELTEAIEQHIGLPCIVKPVMSSSGKGQSRIDRMEDIPAAWNHAASAARVDRGEVIVEGVIEFDFEITLLTVRRQAADGRFETRFCEPIGHRQVDGDYVESWQPQPMSARALERARDIALRVTDWLGGHGLFGVELFVRGDEVWFSEVSPRPHDTGLVTLGSQYQSEFELHARAILNLPLDTRLREPAASAVIYGGIAADHPRYRGVSEALAVPGSMLRLFGKPQSWPRRRMGVAIARGQTIEAARAAAREAAGHVQLEAMDQ